MFTVRNSLGRYLTDDGKFVKGRSKACVYYSYRQAEGHARLFGFKEYTICMA